MVSKKTPRKSLSGYYISLVVFLLSLALLLFTLVDVRRGFLFPPYFKVGAPSTLLNLSLYQLPLLLAGGLGVGLAYAYMSKIERSLKDGQAHLKTIAKATAIAIGAFLVIDLFIYRGVPASRFLAAGKMGVGSGPLGLGRAIPVVSFPDWLQPVADGLNYLLVVWHATTLGLLLGSLFLVAGAGLVARLQGKSFMAHLTGSTMALAQPFCSCCAAPIGSALYRKGASLGPVLAFTVSAPMLNITSLILAASLLPTEFALLRIAGGIIVGALVTYGVSLIVGKWVSQDTAKGERSRLFDWSTKIAAAYNRLFHFEQLFSEAAIDSPAALISNWMSTTWRLARVLVPILLVGSIVALYVVRLMPAAGNNIGGVVVTSFFATLLMVPTWTEIPFAAALVNNGLPGIAAAALITLPAVSLPCLVIIAGAIRNLRVVAVLALAVFIAGILAGIAFL